MDLTENCTYKFERKISNKDTYHIKLTTELLEDLENAQYTEKVIINIDKRTGTLTIPTQNNFSKVFKLNIEPIAKGVTESLEVNLFRSNNTVESVAPLNMRINVQATPKLYDMTQKRIIEMEDEHKKHLAKDINLPINCNRNSLANKSVQSKESQKLDGISVNQIHKKTITPISDNNKSMIFSIREKVLHMLALKTWSKDALLLNLRKFGVTSVDRSEVEKTLHQIATLNKDNTYQLSNQFVLEIRDDWPQFNDDNRRRIAKLKSDFNLRTSNQFNPGFKKSPCTNRSDRQYTISPVESHSSSKAINSNDEGFMSGGHHIRSPYKLHNDVYPNKRRSQHLSKDYTTETDNKKICLSTKKSSQSRDFNSSSSCDVTPKSDVSQCSTKPTLCQTSNTEGTQAKFNVAYEEYSRLCSKLKRREYEIEKLRSKCKNAKNVDFEKMYKIAKSFLDEMSTPQFQDVIARVKTLESEMCGHLPLLTAEH